MSYSTLRRLLERDVNYEVLNLIAGKGPLSLGIDEHSFRHQEMVFTVTEVKQRRMLGILKDDRTSSLKAFLSRLPAEKLREEQRQRVDSLLRHYPNIKAFYWAKEALRGLYQQEDKAMGARQLDNIILNLKAGDDGELIRWCNTLKRWQVPILNHFDNRTTNGFTEGCNTKIKMLKRLSYGLRNVGVCWRKMLLRFVPSPSYFHTV